MTQWEVIESDRAKAERQKVADELVESHGKEFADRWTDGLLDAIYGLERMPGPRAWHRVEAEEERRRMEVRLLVYGGPGRRPARAVSYSILYSVHDPAPGESDGVVNILRIVHAASEEAARFLVSEP